MSDIIEEEDKSKSMFLYLKHGKENYNYITFKDEYYLSSLSKCSNNTLHYFLSKME